MTGEFQALGADSAKLLWSFRTPSGILGQPITWEKDGKQYVTVMSGIGGVYALRAGDPNLANVPAGVRSGRSGCAEYLSIKPEARPLGRASCAFHDEQR